MAEPRGDRACRLDHVWNEGRDRLLRQPAHWPADADRGNYLARVVAQRRRDAAHADFALLVLDGAAAQANILQHLLELLAVGDGLRRARGEPAADDAFDDLLLLERKNDLTLRGAVR